jgi:hypothetical protein
MSYIRQGSDGRYVEIPGGSSYYLYDNGRDIGGWSHEQWAAIIGGLVDELDPWMGEPTPDEIRSAFEEHYGGWDDKRNGGIRPPERAEIFCQCVDSRIDGLELTDELQEAAQEWADSFDATRKCDHCGQDFYPSVMHDGTNYYCDEPECKLADTADTYRVSIRIARNSKQLYHELKENYGYDSHEASDEESRYLLENMRE